MDALEDVGPLHGVSFEPSQLNNVAFEASQLNNVAFEPSQLNNVAFEASQLNNVAFEASQSNNIDYEASQTMTIPTPIDDDSGVESMATTCSSLDSNLFLKSDSDNSLNLDVERDLDGEEQQVEVGPKALPIITMDEVGEHYTTNDAWMVIYDKVYDFTDFMFQVSLTSFIIQ